MLEPEQKKVAEKVKNARLWIVKLLLLFSYLDQQINTSGPHRVKISETKVLHPGLRNLKTELPRSPAQSLQNYSTHPKKGPAT